MMNYQRQPNNKIDYSEQIDILELEPISDYAPDKINLIVPQLERSNIIERARGNKDNKFSLTSDTFAFLDKDLPSLNSLTEPIVQPLAQRLKKHRKFIKWGIRCYQFTTGFGLFLLLSSFLYYSGSSFSHLNHF